MTTKPFDQYNKRLFQELLSPFGQVIPNRVVLGEERAIDVFFIPHPDVVLDPAELGYLARMVPQPTLLEPFRSALSDEDVRNCLLKLFLVLAEGDLPPNGPSPHLWILAAEVSDRLLTDFNATLAPDLPDGFYRLAKGLNTTIVALDELPTVPETLWLRLLAKGRIQEAAIAELLQLPDSDPKRVNGLNLLAAWRINMEVMDEVAREERRILMALSQAYLEWERQTEKRGLDRGIERGMDTERRSTITTLMQTRFGAIDPELERLIPDLMALTREEAIRVLVQRSREELIQYFQN